MRRGAKVIVLDLQESSSLHSMIVVLDEFSGFINTIVALLHEFSFKHCKFTLGLRSNLIVKYDDLQSKQFIVQLLLL